jgi:mono/diheme cytochrome c family protein
MQPRRFVLSTIVLSLFNTWPVAQANDAARTTQDGLFTLEQAARGERVYQAECASCHAPDMKGGPAARGLSGLTFRYQWADRPLAALFDVMREKMPPGKPGALREQAYLDLLAAILKRNDFPPGEAELEADEKFLRSMLIRWQRPD